MVSCNIMLLPPGERKYRLHNIILLMVHLTYYSIIAHNFCHQLSPNFTNYIVYVESIIVSEVPKIKYWKLHKTEVKILHSSIVNIISCSQKFENSE